jgi:carbohydrate diacid regulator
MQINEFVAETILNKISGLVNREIVIGDALGNVLASTNLSRVGENYSQLQKAAQGATTVEITKEDYSFTKNPLGVGVILPLIYNGEIVSVLYVQDEADSYQKYMAVIKTTAELLIYQTLVIDNVPYKDRIKDNFIFGLLHRKLSWDDPRTYEEAELLEVSLHKDKAVLVVYVPGFWQTQFTGEVATSEDERQSRIHQHKKKIYDSIKEFFKDASGVQISYFGNDTFVVMIDELASIKGPQMITQIRDKASQFNGMLHKKFDKDVEKVVVGIGNFYRGKDGVVLAYEEAKVALQLGMTFSEERPIYHIDDLGMVAILAGGNKRWQENFVRNLLTQLLQEKYLIETVDMFFDQNMSLTLTAEALGIHRNTLLYRLSKVKKITGLDPRNFNDAIKIKLASILSQLLQKERA